MKRESKQGVRGGRIPSGVVLAMLVLGCAVAARAAQPPAGAPAAPAVFQSSIDTLPAAVRARMTGVSWRPGCPVALDDLRMVTVRHWDFDSRVRTGVLVVHREVAASVVRIMKRLFEGGFPIAKMRLIDDYGGDDWVSIEDNNTSAFNGRRATGSRNWSKHAYGLAIDINPIQNPYVSRGRTSHPASVPYLDRSVLRPGMAYRGGLLVEAFRAEGWSWGGSWTRGIKDYQHFSYGGR